MKTKKALEKIQRINGVPMLRQCCVCEDWLDKQSATIARAAKTRKDIEYVVSHGLCEDCYENGELR